VKNNFLSLQDSLFVCLPFLSPFFVFHLMDGLYFIQISYNGLQVPRFFSRGIACYIPSILRRING